MRRMSTAVPQVDLGLLYRKLRLIRRAEEEIARIYPSDKIKSPVHLSIGQEAVSVGVCDPMRPDDVVSGTSPDEPEALEHASDAFTRIERKVFDAHLGANKFDFRGLDANSLLLFPVGLSFNVVPLHQVFEIKRAKIKHDFANAVSYERLADFRMRYQQHATRFQGKVWKNKQVSRHHRDGRLLTKVTVDFDR